ncbi:MAG: nitroreductase family protein, partial [Candidatus Bipolaricaulota bacterium]|nr:nitroreductase family protein [Candidatus Bipolaricaulota bacterium]
GVTRGNRDSGYAWPIERIRMSKITVDARACIQCGACVRVCAIADVFEIRDGASVAARPEKCWGCGQCVSVCPVDAIDHDAFPLEKCPLVDNGRQPTGEQLAILMRARRSARTFAERPVPRDIVRDLASVSRWGPSAQNSQDVDWVAIDDRARITEMSKATLDEIRRFSHLMRHPVLRWVLRLFLGRELTKSAGRNPRAGEELLDRWAKGLDPVFYNAPVVLVGHTRSRRAFARDDAIYAAYNLMLAAERQGLSTCQIGIFQMTAEHSNKVRRMLGLSEGRTAQVTLVLGYPLHPFRRLVPRRMPELVWNPR